MTEFSQAKVNELIDQYRNGTISSKDRFKLEKQALDDPFLFDALEGYSVLNVDDDKKPASRIFTLPRIGIAASLIILIAVIFNLKSNLNPQSEQDQSIAMVLENEEEPAVEKNVSEEEIKEESASTSSVANESKSKVNAPDKVSKSKQFKTFEKPAAKRRSNTIKEVTPVSVPVKENTKSKDEIADAEIDADILDYDIAEEVVTVPVKTKEPSSDIATTQMPKKEADVNLGNANQFNVLQETSEATIMDSSLSQEALKSDFAEKAKAEMLSVEAVPVIGKEIFDDYARQKIDERGLRQEQPQKVIIEFSIDSNGNLTDFKHIFSGCSECAPFAIYLIQNSGEWKTDPPGNSGRARYTFTF